MLRGKPTPLTVWIIPMSDVKRRYGAYDPDKWETNLRLKDYFEQKMGMDIYTAVDKDSYAPAGDKYS